MCMTIVTNGEYLITVSFSLIDVEENALLRDGAATANSLYGNSHAINSAYYGLFIILEKIHDLGKYDVDFIIFGLTLITTSFPGCETGH
jgi:geranylgeranyl pyrophosphate synthase